MSDNKKERKEFKKRLQLIHQLRKKYIKELFLKDNEHICRKKVKK